MRAIYKSLTKEMLEEYGITSIKYVEETNSWEIKRLWFKNRSKNKQETTVKVLDAVCRHKFTKDKYYPIVNFSYNSKMISLPLARIIYAWFKGPIEDGFVIDHIDNNPYNNKPENLQKITQKQNIAKRYIDNKNNHHNQWDALKEKEYQIVHQAFIAGKTFAEACEALENWKKENGLNDY